MEGDHDQAPARRKDLKRSSQTLAQSTQLVVDVHAYRLECARRWMNVRRPGGSGNRRLDGSRQLQSGAKWPAIDDEPCDSRRPPFLTQAPDEAGEIALRQLVDHLRGGKRAAPVHAHVQGPVLAKAEASRRVIELGAGHAEVEEHTVRTIEARRSRNSSQVAKVAPAQHRRRA